MYIGGYPKERKQFGETPYNGSADISEQGKTNGNLEYSSMIFRKYLFLLFEGNGPLKSMLILSNGWVDLIR